MSRDLDDLLDRFLENMKEIVGARAAAVRLRDDSGRMRLVASTGLDEAVVELERTLPASDCLCGRAADADSVLSVDDARACSARIGRPIVDHN